MGPSKMRRPSYSSCCFYEMIRADRPCKAYFDLEVGGGILSQDEGACQCQQVIAEWANRIQLCWPEAVKDFPRCLDQRVLNCSRQTNKGWKVDYHLLFLRQKSLRSVNSLTCKSFWQTVLATGTTSSNRRRYCSLFLLLGGYLETFFLVAFLWGYKMCRKPPQKGAKRHEFHWVLVSVGVAWALRGPNLFN